MNTDSCRQQTRVAATVVAILGTFLIVAVLVALLRHYTEVPSLSADRAAERMKILKEFTEANAQIVNTYGWQDQTKGIVRVPLDRAKELVLEEWQNPVAAHSNLMERAAKAFAAPPKAPAPKNPYE